MKPLSIRWMQREVRQVPKMVQMYFRYHSSLPYAQKRHSMSILLQIKKVSRLSTQVMKEPWSVLP